MLNGLTNSGSIPALERLMQFSSARHRLIAHNVANLSTPGFRPVDVSPEEFQQQLASAVQARRNARAAPGPSMPSELAAGQPDTVGLIASSLPPLHRRADEALPMQSTRQVEVRADRLILHAEPMDDNVLFHDGNDRSVERIMQDLVENFMTYRTAAQFLQRQFNQIQEAIRERV
jgi:flagellar basal-body rod protein FlgB